MPTAAERDIQLHFLDEAADYLNEIESTLLGLSSTGIEPQQVDLALRAAHSIKGGAAMMGFQVLSDLAHQFEDSFKVLKLRREQIDLDTQLETLLLDGLDSLRRVRDGHRDDVELDDAWLSDNVFPIFAQLHDRLGDLQPEDETALLSADEGTDMATIMFATEVDTLLTRLEEKIVQLDDLCLRTEVELMAQELGGLGEMLQLDGFVRLCSDVERQLKAHPDGTPAIAQAALEGWRQTQALIAINQRDLLPVALELESALAASPVSDGVDLLANGGGILQNEGFVFEPEGLPLEPLGEDSFDVAAAIADFAPTDVLAELPLPGEVPLAAEMPNLADIGDLQEAIAQFEPESESVSSAALDLPIPGELGDIPALNDLQDAIAHFEPVDPAIAPALSEPTRVAAPVAPTSPPQAKTKQRTASSPSREATVRVPVRQLDTLNDLFGELIIERNALNLRLDRLKTLVSTLRLRVNHLEKSNTQLRTYYDRVATESVLFEPVRAMAGSPTGSESTPQGPSLPSLHAGFDILEMDRYSDLHLLSQEQMETIVQIQEVTGDINLNLTEVNQTTHELNRTAKDLQTNVTRARMRPLSDITGRFPRAVRDLSVQFSKPVDLFVSGDSTSIDRLMLEALNDPLMHLLRNAFDHGIESSDRRKAAGKTERGRIDIRAFHRGSQTFVTISDDGGGIDLEKIRDRARTIGYDEAELQSASKADLLDLIFEPGFSTAERVTALSGRGVGMDVVRTNLKRIRGSISVDTEPGQGTTFTLAIPFTLSILRALVVESNGARLVLPADSIDEIIRLDESAVIHSKGNELYPWDDTMMPLVRLGEWLQFRCPRPPQDTEASPTIDTPTILIVDRDTQLTGLQIDRFWGEQEVAVRQVESTLSMPPGFTGCTVLGDGQVVPLADVSELLNWIESKERGTSFSTAASGFSTAVSGNGILAAELEARDDDLALADIPAPPVTDTILIVDDSVNVRRFLAMTLDKAGYRVEQAKDGQDAVDKLLGGLQVNAVICDVEMPRLDGFGVLAQLRASAEFKQLPIAMLTSRSGDKHRQLAARLGASAYFSKPYNEQELLRTLKEIAH